MKDVEEFIKEIKNKRLISTYDKPLNVTTQPTKFPKKQYTSVKQLQPVINQLLYNAMNDSSLLDLKCNDKMFLILKRIIKAKNRKNAVEFMFLRTDYLLDISEKMKMVETNTISCSFVAYGPILNELHGMKHSVEKSDSLESFVKMVKNCKKIFSKNYGVQGSLALMLDNFTDERCSNLQEKLILIKELKKEGVEILHVTEKDLNYLTFRNNFMYYKNRPVFLLYYRWYYNAEHYSEEFIKIRIRIEQSNTISLPSAEAQLIGSKFFQLIFNDEEILRKYINEQSISDIKNIFTVYKSIEEYKIGDEDEYLIKSYSEGGNNILESPNENCFLMKRI
ncbi:hypothetical protein H311_00396, partial [Anncaliia algerae PRA109]